jgi:hypothetical protein
MPSKENAERLANPTCIDLLVACSTHAHREPNSQGFVHFDDRYHLDLE